MRCTLKREGDKDDSDLMERAERLFSAWKAIGRMPLEEVLEIVLLSLDSVAEARQRDCVWVDTTMIDALRSSYATTLRNASRLVQLSPGILAIEFDRGTGMYNWFIWFKKEQWEIRDPKRFSEENVQEGLDRIIGLGVLPCIGLRVKTLRELRQVVEERLKPIPLIPWFYETPHVASDGELESCTGKPDTIEQSPT